MQKVGLGKERNAARRLNLKTTGNRAAAGERSLDDAERADILKTEQYEIKRRQRLDIEWMTA